MKRLRPYQTLLLAGLIILMAITPAALSAAAQGGVNGGDIFFPLMFKSGNSGGSPPGQEPGPTPTATPGPTPGPGIQDILENGSTVIGPGGAGLGALANTLDAPIEVSIAIANAPGVPIPGPAQISGDYYLFGAETDLFVTPEEPILLALPLPPGLPTTNLAAALLTSEEGANDAAGEPLAWSFQEGMVDIDQGLFLTTLLSLPEAGQLVALVEHPDYESPSNDALPPASAGVNSTTGADFRVRCVNFSQPTDCTLIEEAYVEEVLSYIHSHLIDELGFKEPRLRYLHETLHFNPNSLTSLGYAAYIEPTNYGFCGSGDIAGYYQPSSGRLVLCLNPAIGIHSNTIRVLIHEFFHAVQYSYLATLADYFDQSEEKWVIEGTAASAMDSFFADKMVRTNYYGELHDVDLSLKTFGDPLIPYEYRAQDYWVYYGQRNGDDLSYLKQLFELGGNSRAASEAFDDGNLLSDYWNWAKNHVMEPVVDYDGLLGTPCELEEKVVILPEVATFGGYSGYHDVRLEPLSSIVVDVRWDWDGYSFAEGRVFPTPNGQDLTAASQALRMKFYEEGEGFCEAVPDRGRTYNNPDPNKTYYLLISNIGYDTAYDYRIGFETYPTPP